VPTGLFRTADESAAAILSGIRCLGGCCAVSATLKRQADKPHEAARTRKNLFHMPRATSGRLTGLDMDIMEKWHFFIKKSS